MAFGLDDLIGAIFTGGDYTRQKKLRAQSQEQQAMVDRLNAEKSLNIPQGATIQDVARGQTLQSQGVQPQTQGPMTPQFMQPGPGMGQNVPQMPQQQPVFPQPAIGGQGPTNLPMSQGQAPQDTRSLNLHALWQQQYQQANALNTQKEQAGIADTKSQTYQRTALGDLASARAAQPGGGQGGQQLAPDHMAALRYGVEIGILAPQEMTFRGPKTTILAEGIMNRPDFQDWYSKQQPGTIDPLASNFNPMQSDVTFTGNKIGEGTAQRYQRGGPAQTLGRYASSTRNVIQLFSQASEAYDRMPVEFLNTPYNAMAKQTSGPALRFRNFVADLRAHMATMYAKGNAPQDLDRKQAVEAIPDTITPNQARYMIPYWNQIVDSQVEGMMTPVGQPDVQSANQRLGQAGITTNQGLKPGTIKKGYKFKGGNPADKNSWVKQ